MHIGLGIGMAACLLLGQAGGRDESGLKNPDFEEGDVGAAPAGWTLTTKGGTATISADNPRRGKQCVRVGIGDGAENAPRFLVLLQQVDPAPYRGKMIRLKAAVRIDAGGPLDRAQLWLRVDRQGGRTGFFDNMDNRPIRGKTWGEYEIVGDVAKDAELIVLGIIVSGTAPAWIDDFSLKAEADAPGATAEPPRPLAGRGLQTLVAFTRLLGYVRHFHPSDQAAEADWDRLAVEGMRRPLERAKDPDELARRLGVSPPSSARRCAFSSRGPFRRCPMTWPVTPNARAFASWRGSILATAVPAQYPVWSRLTRASEFTRNSKMGNRRRAGLTPRSRILPTWEAGSRAWCRWRSTPTRKGRSRG